MFECAAGSETELCYDKMRYLIVVFLPKAASNGKVPSGSKTKEKETTKTAKVNVNKLETTEQLSRQQWKNKMKNKKKCKNKYKQNKAEEEVDKVESAEKREAKEEVKRKPNMNKNSKKIGQTPVKRKENIVREENKSQNGKNAKDGRVEGTRVSPADGSEEPAVEITEHQQHLPTKRLKPELSAKQRLKREKLRKLLRSRETEQQESPAEVKQEPAVPKEEVTMDRSASLRHRMEQRLESARFRYINEVLYSTSSGEAKHMFTQDPEAFWVYHKGYTAQVQRWPTNPVDQIISYIRQK